MKVLQNLYYIYKIKSDKINNLKTYSFKEASKNGDIVSIGDNLVLSKIREYYGNNMSHIELYNLVQDIRKEIKFLKKNLNKENSIKIKKYQDRLNKLLYIDDIINIKVMTKKGYKNLARYGFDLNGKHYIRFMVGSGQMRRNTVTFINEELFDYMQENLMCGLNDKIKKINLAKLSAYYALSFSSVLWVRNPRVCVIKDFETIVPNQKINWIYIDDNDKKQVKEVTKDFKLNSADGQGLISPDMAELWSKDMHLNYTPCSFVIRSAFIKGNLVTFDFKQYAKENNITSIKDRYGTSYNIDDIDVLLSEGQFKMAKYYSSWEGYLSYFNSYNLKWGVARYNKQFDDECALTNYQYLQVLNLDKEDIKGLVSYTSNWIKNICNGDLKYTMAYNIGVKDIDGNINDIINSCNSTFTKAIIKNKDMLEDTYIQKKIYNSIKESIRQAKLGRIWVKGNYQFMISDPIAQVRSALGLKPDGFIPANNIYSNFWNKRTKSKEVVCCRSPLTHYSEIVPLKLFNDDETNKWFKYIYSGIIYSVYDIATLQHADSDFDGDIVFSTDNKYFIKGACRNELPITYDKEKVPSQKITLPNQIKCDIRGLDTKVGQITNYSTSMLAMLPMFNGDKQKEQKKEIKKRLKLLRELQGAEIDKIKGTTPPQFPKEWRHYVNIEPNDTDVEKSDKYKYNSMVVKKKPYFFIYLYPKLMNEYKTFKKSFDSLSWKYFGISLIELLKKDNKNGCEINLLRRYRKYCPVLETKCLMNILCKEIENIEFNIKYKKINNNVIEKFKDNNFIYDKKIMKKIYELYREYKALKKYKGITNIIENEGIKDDEINEMLKDIMYIIKDEYKDKMKKILNSSYDLFNYLIIMADLYKIKNKDFIWDILGDDIIDVIPISDNYIIVNDKNGFEYLGENYRLEQINNASI